MVTVRAAVTKVKDEGQARETKKKKSVRYEGLLVG